MLTKSTPEIKELIEKIEECRNVDSAKQLELADDLYNMAQEDGNEDLKDLSSCILGDACMKNYDFSYAIYLLSAGINGVAKTDEYVIAARCLNDLGIVMRSQGHYISAEEALMRGINISREHKLYMYEAMACSNFANLCQEMDDYEHALEYLYRAIECFNFMEDEALKNTYIISVLASVVHLYIMMDNALRANAVYREMEIILRENNIEEFDFAIEVVRLIYAHYSGNSIAETRAKDAAIKRFYELTTYNVYVDEVMKFFEYFLKKKEFKKLEELMEHFQSISVCEDMVNQFIHVQELYMKMYEEMGNREKLLEASYNYVTLLSKKTDEAKRSFAMTVKLQTEVNQQKISNLFLSAAAETDALTGLANRSKLNIVIDELFATASMQGKYLGVEMLDLDHFKDINDSMGHAAGDNLLKRFADILKEFKNEKVFVARYGGDEFILFYYDMVDEAIMDISKQIHEKVIELGHELSMGKLSVSQGIVNHIPLPNNKAWDYMAIADEALYQVKNQGRGNCRFVNYRSDLDKPWDKPF